MVERMQINPPVADCFKLTVELAAAIGLLYVGGTFLVPLAIAILVSSLLGALIDQVARLRLGNLVLPHWIAVLVSICIIFGAAAVFGKVIA